MNNPINNNDLKPVITVTDAIEKMLNTSAGSIERAMTKQDLTSAILKLIASFQYSKAKNKS